MKAVLAVLMLTYSVVAGAWYDVPPVKPPVVKPPVVIKPPVVPPVVTFTPPVVTPTPPAVVTPTPTPTPPPAQPEHPQQAVVSSGGGDPVGPYAFAFVAMAFWYVICAAELERDKDRRPWYCFERTGYKPPPTPEHMVPTFANP